MASMIKIAENYSINNIINVTRTPPSPDSLSSFVTERLQEIPTVVRFSRGMETTVAVIILGYLLLGLSGNLLTIIALLRCPRVRNVTAAFIISLCIADCLFCVLVLPWEVSRFFAGEWVWGQGLICTIIPLIRYWNVGVSLLSIAMITVNRYIMIAHFGIYNSVYKKGWIALMIAFCWLFPFCTLFPTLIGKWGRFGMIEELETCSIIDENGQSPKKVLFGLGFCVPALVIIICYSLIFYVIRQSESRIRNHVVKSSSASKISGVELQPKLPTKNDKEEKRKKNEWRITKMVMIIYITFLVTYLPITLVKFFDPMAEYRTLHLIGYVFIYLSCCINPVIYVIMNRQYRLAYKTVLLCKSPRLRSFSSQGDQVVENPAMRYLNRLSLSNALRMSNIVHDIHELEPPNNNNNPVNLVSCTKPIPIIRAEYIDRKSRIEVPFDRQFSLKYGVEGEYSSASFYNIENETSGKENPSFVEEGENKS